MHSIADIENQLRCLSDDELREMILTLSRASSKKKTMYNSSSNVWYRQKICGLSAEGIKRLKELEEESQNPINHVDRKQLRYLKALKNMRLSFPLALQNETNPKSLYNYLLLFSNEHDIPEEIVHRVVPAIVSYIETGHMRLIIFVGDKGCGKTTAVRLLMKEALHLPTEVIKIPQTDGGHGMTGDCGSYQSADVGCIAKAQIRSNSLLVAFVFDEIDKVTHDRNRANVDDELLSITDESNTAIYDNYLECTLAALEHCPMFFTANDLQKVNPILADRCTIIRFPNANAQRIKSITGKYVKQKLKDGIYHVIDFDYELLNNSVETLVHHNVTSLRKHQQVVENVLDDALSIYLRQTTNLPVKVNEKMFADAQAAILASERRKAGF